MKILNKCVKYISIILVCLFLIQGVSALTPVAVTSPNGGELWGGTKTVTWDASGMMPEYKFYVYARRNADPLQQYVIDISGLSDEARQTNWNTLVLSDGLYKVRIRVFDTVTATTVHNAYSGGTEDSSTGMVTVDNSDPESSVTALSSYKNTPNFGIAYTANDVVTNGVQSGLNYVELYYKKDGGDWTKYDGTYTSSPITFDTSSLGGDGSYEFYTRATDIAGNIEDAPGSADTTTIVDTVNPTATFTSFSPEGLTNLDSVTFAASCTDSGSGKATCDTEVSFNSGGWVNVTSSPYALTTNGDGSYNFRIKAIDNAGNQDFTTTKQVTRDNAPPIVTITNAPAGRIIDINGAITPAMSCSDAGTGCNSASYVFKYYVGNPEACSSTYADYTDSGAITTRRWVCAGALDNAGTFGKSSPIDFNIYSSIQSAIDAASPGEVLEINSGVYAEDLTIPAGKDNLELKPATGATVTIKGIQKSLTFPLARPNIEILSNGVKIHGFTIESPTYESGKYSSGLIIGAQNVEVYGNNFVVNSAGGTDSGEVSQAIQTYATSAVPTVDVSGLNIHNNTFTSTGSGDWGYEGIYINPDADTSTVTIFGNVFSGKILRAVTSERSRTLITQNTIITDLVPSSSDLSTAGGYQGINVRNVNTGEAQSDVAVTGNIVKGSGAGKGFNQGIRIGQTGQTLTNFSITSNTLQMNNVSINVKTSANEVTIKYNTITDNSIYGLQNEHANFLNAENNWYGYVTGPHVTGINPDGQGNDITGNVDFSPWSINTNHDVDIVAPTPLINSPAASIWFNNNFTAEFNYADTGGSGLKECKYKVVSNGVITENYKSAGACSGSSTLISKLISVGAGKNCRDEGVDKCEVFVNASDNSNNGAVQVSRTFSIDLTAPAVAAGTDKVTKVQVSQDATVTDATSGIASYLWTKVSGLGAITFGTPTAKDTTIRADTDGVYNITLTVTDNAGNTAYDEISFTWDTAVPTTSDDYGTKNNVWQNADQIIILTPADSLSGVAATKYCIDTADSCDPSSGTSYTKAVTISTEGTNYFRYQSTDNAGNVQAVVSKTVKIDKSGPSITHTQPIQKRAVGETTEISAIITDANPIDNVKLYYTPVGGSETSVAMTNLIGLGTNYTAVIPASTQSGNVVYHIVAQDNVGTKNTATTSTYTISVTSLVLDLSAEWNLVSVPKKLTSNNKETVLPGRTVWEYNRTGQSGSWLAATTIDPGKGYWVNQSNNAGVDYDSSCSGPLCGPSETIYLQPGWNLMGHMCTTAQKPNIAFSDAYQYLFVLKYDRQTDAFGIHNTVNNFDMGPGEGYWVFLVSETQLPYTNVC